jgi:hypothetical protein
MRVLPTLLAMKASGMAYAMTQHPVPQAFEMDPGCSRLHLSL